MIRNKTLRVSALAWSLACLPMAAGAAGLGKLTVLSGLGQPLRAEIEVSASREEFTSLTARLASADSFKQAGIEFASSLTAARMNVSRTTDGRTVILMSTERPINEPFIEMLVELNWAAGRLVRQYTFLLDPPAAVVARQSVQPVAVPKAAAPAPAAPAPTAARPDPEQAKTRLVKEGDTLHRIATETRPEGVTLDQMLVSIFRANPEAFDGNMNRMRAGAILKIPERPAVATTAEADATKVVRAHGAEYAQYRSQLAATVAAAPAPAERAPQQAAAGKITPKVEEKEPAPGEPRDQVKVSKATEAAEKGAGLSERAAQARITALEEDLVAKEKALKEANSRLSDLEKNIGELQKLLEIKSKSLADAEKAVAAKPAAPPPPPEPAKVAEAPKPVEPPKAPEAPKPIEPIKAPETAPPTSPPPPPPAVEAKPEPPKPAPPRPAAPPPPPPPEPSLVSELMSNPVVLAGGALVIGLLGFLGYRTVQRRKEEAAPPPTISGPSEAAPSVFGATGGQSVDTTASSIQTDFSQSAMSAIDADEGVDPVAEADVYMAYGRDAQAEEILLDALKNEPTRFAIHVKLLEIYAQRKNVKQFETLAGELYSQTGGKGAEWDKAASLGRKLDPTNPLFGGGAQAPAPDSSAFDKTVVSASPEKLRDTWTMPGELGQIASAVEGGTAEAPTVKLDKSPIAPQPAGGDVDFDLGVSTAEKPTTTQAGHPASLDFDLGLDFSTPGRSAESLATAETIVLEPGAADKASAEMDVPLDLDVKLPGEDRGKADIGLDFDLGAPAAAEPKKREAATPPPMEATDVAGSIMDISLEAEPQKAPTLGSGVVDLEHTDVGENLMQINLGQTGPAAGEEAGIVDLEKTDYKGAQALDFDFSLERPEQPQEAVDEDATRVLKPAPVDLSAISLDLGEPQPSGEGAPTAAGEENPEITTKLELAKAYEEMGDREGARELLEEVAREGSAEQQEKARQMLGRLG